MSVQPSYPQIILALTREDALASLSAHIASLFPEMEIIAQCTSSSAAKKAILTPFTPPRRLIFVDSPILETSAGILNHLISIGCRSDCVLVAYQPDFTQLQSALRCGVTDCILYPFSAEELSDIFKRMMDKRLRRDANIPTEANEASRYMFWKNDVHRLSSSVMSIAQVNQQYGTHFDEGLFRALFVELTCPGNEKLVIDNTLIQDQIVQMCCRLLQAECFDILYNRHANGVSFLLNFSSGKRGHVSHLIDLLYFDLREQLGEQHRIEVTMSIGRIYSEFSKLSEAKQEILDARWARKQLGSGRIINAEEIMQYTLTPEQKRMLFNYRDLILHYYELLDSAQAIRYIDEFYSTFGSVLQLRELRVFSRELLDFLFHNYDAELQSYGSTEALRHSYIARESTANSFEQLHQVSTENVRDLMEKISAIIRRQYSQPVRDAISYISLRHCRKIRLTALAQSVSLSPQYLSTLFHKETGQTLTEYITGQKLVLAQSLLAHSSKNISEIADYLGFVDAHSFSKFFKTHQHVAPSEYRRIAQAKGRPSSVPSRPVPDGLPRANG